jgi:hypothetical protein
MGAGARGVSCRGPVRIIWPKCNIQTTKAAGAEKGGELTEILSNVVDEILSDLSVEPLRGLF